MLFCYSVTCHLTEFVTSGHKNTGGCNKIDPKSQFEEVVRNIDGDDELKNIAG